MGWMIESVREADVRPAAVFALYADPASWPRWGHNAVQAWSDGPLVPGGIVNVRANYRTVYHCQVRRLEPDRALEIVVRPAFLTIINVYEVEPAPAGARVRHAFQVSGPLAGLTRRVGLDRTYAAQLDEEVAAVIRLASGASEPDLPAPTRSRVSAPERVWHGLGRLLRGGRD